MHERNDHPQHEWRMEQPESRRCGYDQGVRAPHWSAAQAEAGTERRALDEEPDSLEEEVRGWQSIAAPSRDRDDQVVQEAGRRKGQQRRAGGAEPVAGHPDDQVAGQQVEGQVPAPAPELA